MCPPETRPEARPRRDQMRARDATICALGKCLLEAARAGPAGLRGGGRVGWARERRRTDRRERVERPRDARPGAGGPGPGSVDDSDTKDVPRTCEPAASSVAHITRAYDPSRRRWPLSESSSLAPFRDAVGGPCPTVAPIRVIVGGPSWGPSRPLPLPARPLLACCCCLSCSRNFAWWRRSRAATVSSSRCAAHVAHGRVSHSMIWHSRRCFFFALCRSWPPMSRRSWCSSPRDALMLSRSSFALRKVLSLVGKGRHRRLAQSLLR